MAYKAQVTELSPEWLELVFHRKYETETIIVEVKDIVSFSHEPTYKPENGCIVLYNRPNNRGSGSGITEIRVNMSPYKLREIIRKAHGWSDDRIGSELGMEKLREIEENE